MSDKANDINSLCDIKLLVDTFYEKVQKDELLSPVFNKAIQDKWDEHLEKMYRFWQTILLEEHSYIGNPFLPHSNLSITQKHFQRWLKLWHTTVNQFFAGKKAEEAKWRSNKMAAIFSSKIEYYKDHASRPLL